MKEFVGNKVSIFLKNGLSVEGVLRNFDNDFITLSADNGNLLLINNDKENILMIKIILYDDVEDFNKRPDINKAIIREPDPPELDHRETNIIKRTQKLLSLKNKANTSLRRSIANYLQNKMQEGNKVDHYVFPDFKK